MFSQHSSLCLQGILPLVLVESWGWKLHLFHSLPPCVESDLIVRWRPPLNQLQNAIKRHYRDAAVIKTSRCPFNILQSIQLIRFPPVPFSQGCHQFAISHGPSGAIIDDVLEWDEGNLRFNFIGKVEGRFASRLTPMCSEWQRQGPYLADMLGKEEFWQPTLCEMGLLSYKLYIWQWSFHFISFNTPYWPPR